MLCYDIFIILCCTMLYSIMLCYAILCNVMLCNAILCYIILHYIKLYCIVPYLIIAVSLLKRKADLGCCPLKKGKVEVAERNGVRVVK